MIEIRSVDGLEVYSAAPLVQPKPAHIVFVHGAFAGGWIWADHYLPWFAGQGYRAHALSLRGHGGSHGHAMLAWHSISDYVDDLKRVVDWLGDEVILVGHSMGGFVVQKYIERHPAEAVVLMCSAPPQGLLAAQFHLLIEHPRLFLDINNIMNGHYANTSIVQEALFAQPVGEETLASFLTRMQSESQRALWDMTTFNFPALSRRQRPPMLVLGAEKDVLVPAFLVQTTARTYDLPDHIFPDMGHALTHERDWPLVAAHMRDWLGENGF